MQKPVLIFLFLTPFPIPLFRLWQALESATAEHRAYKERAHRVLAEQQERLQQVPALAAAAAECAQLRERARAADEQWHQRGAPAVEECEALRTRVRAAERDAEAARAEAALGESRAQQRGREEEQVWTAKVREAKLGAWSERPPPSLRL